MARPCTPQVIKNDLFVTKTLSVAKSPGSLSPNYGLGAKLIVNGRTSSGALGIGPWPANPNKHVFFGVGTLNQSDAKNYALLQAFEGTAKGRTYLNSPKDIRFRINNSDKMMLSNNGNVGIGTTDPWEKLTVVGECIVLASSTASDKDQIKICTTYSPGGPILHNRNSISSNERLTLIAATGFISLEAQTGVVIGRGISSPQADLHVVGEIALEEVNVWDGKDDNDLTWNGLQISREGSSRRYKKNIGPLKADFRKILDLEPKQFQMKEGFGEPDEWLFGYIAEDLDELGLKRLCNYDKDNRPDGIKYKKIAMYVLEIAKEQQKRINQLEESFKRMERLLAEKINTTEIKTQTPD
ncbi:tail fiber domain-containing protein [candidate division KSB1 bacterium]|nr:tail fiber domain-containing protein [candidate division KSB1 bacterium]